MKVILIISLILVHIIYLFGTWHDLLNLAAFELVILSVIISFALKWNKIDLKDMYRTLIAGKMDRKEEIIRNMYTYSVTLKEKGFLQLEKRLFKEENQFLRRGGLLAIEEMSESELRAILTNEIKGTAYRYKQMAETFKLISLMAPGLGLIGTMFGMVGVLDTLHSFENINSSLGMAITSTLYGALFANLVALPCYYRIMDILDSDVFEKELIIEGCVGLLNKETPTLLFERLNSFLPENERLTLVKGANGGRAYIERSDVFEYKA